MKGHVWLGATQEPDCLGGSHLVLPFQLCGHGQVTWLCVPQCLRWKVGIVIIFVGLLGEQNVLTLWKAFRIVPGTLLALYNVECYCHLSTY